MKNLFTEEEFPYDELKRVGLTQTMIEDLPMHVLEDLVGGRVSPVLPIRVVDETTGRGGEARARFSLVRNTDDSVGVMFYPVLKSSPLSEYTAEQQTRLLEGKAVLVEKDCLDGTSQALYAQIDKDTNQVVTVPSEVINRNLQTIAGNMKLSAAEVRILQKGDPITYIDDDNESTTLGIDLHDKIGVRFVEGDTKRWSEQSKKDWDKYTFGINGCWVMDDDGNLAYVAEEDYTDELWNEQRRAGQMRGGGLGR